MDMVLKLKLYQYSIYWYGWSVASRNSFFTDGWEHSKPGTTHNTFGSARKGRINEITPG
jgi:hypothetical protein